MSRTWILRAHVNEASAVYEQFQTALPAKGWHISESESTIVAAKLATMDAVISLYHALIDMIIDPNYICELQ